MKQYETLHAMVLCLSLQSLVCRGPRALAATELKGSTWNEEKMEGVFVSVPERLQIPEKINEQYIVELYSK